MSIVAHQEDVRNENFIRSIEKHTMKKKLNVALSDIYESIKKTDYEIISDSRLQQLKECGTWLNFTEFDDGSVRLTNANYCHMRMCPICTWRKSLKLYSQMNQLLDKIDNQSVRWIFLTLTVRNVSSSDLKETVNVMLTAFNRMFSRGRNEVFNRKLKAVLLGHMRALEVTYNNHRDDFHPHIHVLMAVDSSYFSNSKKYIKKLEYAEMWKKALAIDYEPVVDVRNIDMSKSAICECAKYPVKLDAILAIDDFETAKRAVKSVHEALYRKKLVVFGGILRKVRAELKQEDIETANLNDVEINAVNPVINNVCLRWDFRTGAYFSNK